MTTISRTPLIVLFFGGRTDCPDYFERSAGEVSAWLLTNTRTIQRLVYLMSLTFDTGSSTRPWRPPTINADINHPVIRAERRYCEIDRSLALSVLADLPPRSGRGSSSTFTAGYVNLLAHLQKRPIGKLDLAWDAVPIERNVLGESLGVQDQPRAYFCRRLAVQGAWLASCDTATVMTMSRGRLSPSYGPAGSRAQDESDLG